MANHGSFTVDQWVRRKVELGTDASRICPSSGEIGRLPLVDSEEEIVHSVNKYHEALMLTIKNSPTSCEIVEARRSPPSFSETRAARGDVLNGIV